MEKQVVRTIKFAALKYLAIMNESIAKLGKGSKVPDGNHYTILCEHTRGCVYIRPEECVFHYPEICKNDVFCLPTVDEYIKLGMVLRLKRKRFNIKKNEIITLKNVQK